MINIDIPGIGHVSLKHLVLDMNGTIATGGIIDPGLKPVFKHLAEHLDVHVVTADTFGTIDRAAREFGLKYHVLDGKKAEGEQKRDFVVSLGNDNVVAIGNGNNDALMLEAAAIGIAVLGEEGASVSCLRSADLVVRDPRHAFEMLLEPARLKATLRG